MHVLAQMLQLSRQEFERNLVGLTDEDARKRIEPMNCISWIIAHVANQRHSYFIAWRKGIKIEDRYLLYGWGQPASQPPLEEAMSLWNDACNDTQEWLESVTAEDLMFVPAESMEGENLGTLITRCVFHTWDHLGEISSIRQILGHKPPQFVNMHDWNYLPR